MTLASGWEFQPGLALYIVTGMADSLPGAGWKACFWRLILGDPFESMRTPFRTCDLLSPDRRSSFKALYSLESAHGWEVSLYASKRAVYCVVNKGLMRFISW